MGTDSLLIMGGEDPKLKNLLNKLGYTVIDSAATSVPALLAKTVVDLIVVDARLESPGIDLCQYLREDSVAKGIPVVYLSENEKDRATIAGLEKVEFVAAPFTPGKLASQIATMLRLRKITGTKDLNATISEVNASLRDLNARFKRELDEARGIQESLLPKTLPKDDRYEIAVAYQPLEEVGGDWYYINTDTAGRVTVQIADVTGHGLAAAFIGSMTKLALSAANKVMPNELLAEMNRLMSPQMPEGRFVTMSSYLYDPSQGKLYVARAGHPPPLVLQRRTGKIVRLEADGFAVGFFEDGQYELQETTLEIGDIAIVITDGISEAQARSMQAYGLERLSKALQTSSPQASAAGVLEHVLDDFYKFIDGRILKDDVTVIMLKRVK